MTIPIIGQHRTWKDLAFRAQPIAEEPTIMDPHVKPKVIGYGLGMVATRSDDFPCQMMIVVKVESLQENPVESMLKIFAMLINNLETFRCCACQPQHPCAMHRQVVPGKPS